MTIHKRTREILRASSNLQHSLPTQKIIFHKSSSKGCHKFVQEENETPILHLIQWLSIPFDLRRIPIHNGAGCSTLILEWPSDLPSHPRITITLDSRDITSCYPSESCISLSVPILHRTEQPSLKPKHASMLPSSLDESISCFDSSSFTNSSFDDVSILHSRPSFHLRSVSSKIQSRINPFTVRWGSNTLLRLSLALLWTVMGMYIVMKEICVCVFMLVEVLK